MVPGLIGQIQALEVVKIILGFGKENILSERMVIFEGLSMKFRNVRIRGKNPSCITCGDNCQITDVAQFDYSDFCQMNCDLVASIKLNDENTISIESFAEIYNDAELMKNNCLVDCRNQVQFGITHLEKAVNMPFKQAVKDFS